MFNENTKNKIFNLFFFRKCLILLCCLMLLFIFYIKIKKYTIFNKKSNIVLNIENSLKKQEIKLYNCDNKDSRSIFNNKITILNIYNINNLSYLNNMNISNYLLSNYAGLDIFDIIIDESDNEKTDFFDLLSDNILSFKNNNNINRPILYIKKSKIEKILDIKDFDNKIIILDELLDIQDVIKNTEDINIIEKKISDISKKKKYFKKNNDFHKKQDLTVKDFINSMTKIIEIQNFKNIDFPVFAILDPNNKHILITKINGEILYNIENNKLCLPISIKYRNNKLYLADQCDGSIKILDVFNNKIEDFIKDSKLFGITDFEFIDDNNLLISIKNNGSIGIFNLIDKSFKPITDYYNLGEINKIYKYKDKFYFLDISNSILYSFSGNSMNIELDLNKLNDIVLYNNLKSFYIKNDNEFYFLDSIGNRIFNYNNGKILEKNFKYFLYSPNDMVVFANIFYILSDKFIQKVDIYNEQKNNINLYFMNNYSYLNNIFKFNKITINYNELNTYNITDGLLNFESFIKNFDIIPYSPSYLMFIEFDKDDNFISNEIIYSSGKLQIQNFNIKNDRKYYLYGKIYFKSEGQIKVKTFNSKYCLTSKL